MILRITTKGGDIVATYTELDTPKDYEFTCYHIYTRTESPIEWEKVDLWYKSFKPIILDKQAELWLINNINDGILKDKNLPYIGLSESDCEVFEIGGNIGEPILFLKDNVYNPSSDLWNKVFKILGLGSHTLTGRSLNDAKEEVMTKFTIIKNNYE